jgi:hypothetical protein
VKKVGRQIKIDAAACYVQGQRSEGSEREKEYMAAKLKMRGA